MKLVPVVCVNASVTAHTLYPSCWDAEDRNATVILLIAVIHDKGFHWTFQRIEVTRSFVDQRSCQ